MCCCSRNQIHQRLFPLLQSRNALEFSTSLRAYTNVRQSWLVLGRSLRICSWPKRIEQRTVNRPASLFSQWMAWIAHSETATADSYLLI